MNRVETRACYSLGKTSYALRYQDGTSPEWDRVVPKSATRDPAKAGRADAARRAWQPQGRASRGRYPDRRCRRFDKIGHTPLIFRWNKTILLMVTISSAKLIEMADRPMLSYRPLERPVNRRGHGHNSRCSRETGGTRLLVVLIPDRAQ